MTLYDTLLYEDYDTLWHYMIRGYMTLYDKTIYDTGRNFLLPFFVSWMRIIYDMRIYHNL